MINRILNFIFSKKEEGIYRIITIFGIKIATKPLRLRMQNELKRIEEFVNGNTNRINNLNSDLNTLRCIILEQYLKNNKNTTAENYGDFIKKLFGCPIIAASSWTPEYEDYFKYLPILFNNLKIVYYDENIYGDIYALWGTRPLISQFTILKNALYNNKNVVFFEMGFIATIYSNYPLSKTKYSKIISFVFDDLSPYYDARYKNRLEETLEDKNIVLNKKQIERARLNIEKIIKNKITKYNHQPIYKPDIGNRKEKVLVVDQVYGDMSIAKGLANEETFKIALKTAIEQNPNADIIVKIHPDNLHNLYYQNFVKSKEYFERENIYLMSEEINPVSLLEIVDKVYVVTSQLGFEALMMGKEVHVFGAPFYAGYGLTIDYQKCERRTNKRSLEEMFYITYINYSYYVNPEKGERCEIEEAIDYLIKLRKEYFLEFNIRCEDRELIDLSQRDFSLNSGERQTAQTLQGIRKDHLLRYRLAADFLENKFNQNKTLGADIFCGNGYGSYMVASKLKNTKILSIDASKEAIEFADKYYNIENRIKFVNKFFPFELNKNIYDYVISFESIEHIQDDVKFIETITRAIKNNGYWLLSTPNEEVMSLKKNDNKFHFRHYTNEMMNDIFKKYNLEVMEQYGEDTYSINEEGFVTGILSEDKMNLIKNYKGQFMVYILKVVKDK